METMTLMVLPPKLPGALPLLMLKERGEWYQAVNDAPEGSLDKLREEVRSELELRSENPDMFQLKPFCWESLYEPLVPYGLQKRLRAMAERAAANDDDPPLLYVHCFEGLEWIPWELMWDENVDEFLGLQFQIARLPIGKMSPDPPAHAVGGAASDGALTVENVYNLLGEGILQQGNGKDKWQETFSSLGKPRLVEKRWPQEGEEKVPRDVLQQIETPHIIHITCHAEVERDSGEVVWYLRDDLQVYSRSFGLVSQRIRDNSPLVFGNACTSAGPIAGAGPRNFGIGSSFPRKFVEKLGATAFVGTFAPVKEDTAVSFASSFYGHLLGDPQDEEERCTLAKALWKARKEHEHKEDPSWLFYSLYGQPHTTFVVPEDE